MYQTLLLLYYFLKNITCLHALTLCPIVQIQVFRNTCKKTLHGRIPAEDTNYFKWVVFGGSDYCCISGLWVEILWDSCICTFIKYLLILLCLLQRLRPIKQVLSVAFQWDHYISVILLEYVFSIQTPTWASEKWHWLVSLFFLSLIFFVFLVREDNACLI